MFWERFVQECEKKGLKPNPAAKEMGISSASVTKWSNGVIPRGNTLDKIASYFGVSTDYLLGKTNNPLPQSAQIVAYLPYEKRGTRPVIGIASAGTGVFADEEILGWQSVDAEYDTEECFWLKVAGDSMSPKIDDGDLVLIQRDAEIENGSIVVAIVDGMDGFIKRVELDEEGITLCSFNPYYPDLVFKGADAKRVHFIGRARKVERDL